MGSLLCAILTRSVEERRPHSAGSLTLTAGSTLDQDSGDESFGLDNALVWVR